MQTSRLDGARDTPRRYALYARYSTDLQRDKSIADQLAMLEERVRSMGGLVPSRYSDHALSGASIVNRHGLLKLIADAKAGRFDVIMTESFERISRNQAD